MAITFAEYLAKAELDDSRLRASLSRAEKAVEQSANKQQTYLNRIGTGANQAAAGVTKFKIAATSAGATLAFVNPALGGFVSRMSEVSNALRALGLSLGTLGLGAAAALVISYRKEISEWVVAQTELGKALAKSEEQLSKFQARSKEMRDARLVGADVQALRDQLSFERGDISKADLAMKNAARAERGGDPFARDKALIQLDIDSEKEAKASRERRDAEEESAARDRQQAAEAFQRTIERVLAAERAGFQSRFNVAKQAAIDAGLAKPSDFVRADTLEGGLMRAGESRDEAMRAARTNQPETGGFGITTRDSSAFRLQRSDSPAIVIGEQRTEAKKQTDLLKSIDDKFDQAVERILAQFGFGGLTMGNSGLRR